MAQGTYGKLRAFNHFLGPNDTVLLTGATPLGGEVALIGVNEGSIAAVTDEPGGILLITTDTADNDNQFMVAGPFQPDDGGMVMETRFKIPTDILTTTLCVAAGFSETMSLTTPVVPAEYNVATLTVNGTGGMALALFDTDGTVIDWRTVIADAGAVLAGTKCDGSVLGATITADRWYIVKVEVSVDGYAKVYFGDADDADKLVLVAENITVLDNDVPYWAFLAIENRSGNARALEVDYFVAEASVDWSVA